MEHPFKIGNVALPQVFGPFLQGCTSTVEMIGAIQRALEAEGSRVWPEELGLDSSHGPVELLVPEVHLHWRPLIREAIEWSALTFTSRVGMRALLCPLQWSPVLSAKANSA